MNKFVLFVIFSVCGVVSASECNGVNCVYKNKHNIAPNSVPTSVGVVLNSTECVNCEKVEVRTPVSVEICVPGGVCMKDVRSSRDDSRVVYDYGRYEAVVTGKDNKVEVRYRKRLFNR